MKFEPAVLREGSLELVALPGHQLFMLEGSGKNECFLQVAPSLPLLQPLEGSCLHRVTSGTLRILGPYKGTKVVSKYQPGQ